MEEERKNAIAELAYAFWRMDMWMSGFGTYEDIEWAQKWGLLRPLKKPMGIAARVVKRIIKRNHDANELRRLKGEKS